jgi:peptide/nickel transport system ATP-binding protein
MVLLEIRRRTKKFQVRPKGMLARVRSSIERSSGKYAGWIRLVSSMRWTMFPSAWKKGESLGLVGESGCGKSTLARLIARLHDPTSGEIEFEATDIGAYPAHDFVRSNLKKRIQMVFQDPVESLNPSFTANATIADPLRRLGGMKPGVDLRRRVDKLAEMAGLPGDLLSRYPHQLFGGQMARVGIARAIALEPSLLVLDEPTSALDVSVQAVTPRLLEDLKNRLGMSYFFVSHDLNVVRLLCQRVLVMYFGKIVESGPVAELFEWPRHPYTKALLSAVPAVEKDDRTERIRLSGEPVSPIDPSPNLCRFYSRCPKADAFCQSEMPVLRPYTGGAEAACHYSEEYAEPPEEKVRIA